MKHSVKHHRTYNHHTLLTSPAEAGPQADRTTHYARFLHWDQESRAQVLGFD